MAKPIVVIVGETASGKSDLAMRLAEHYDGEIICADAWTIRKGMDIGTAKPNLNDQKRVPHHLLDLVNPDEPFSAAAFQKKASVVIHNIHKRDKLPIIVGGSGLYIDSLIYNYSFLTTDSNVSRDDLNNLRAEDLLAIINKERINVEGVDIANKRRLIRLIETKGIQPSKHVLTHNTLLLGLTTDRDKLRARLEGRLQEMFAKGLEQEVRSLSHQYGWQAEAMKGIGYREWQDYFSGSINESELKERIINSSMMLAKKQRTWFKKNKDINWIVTPVIWPEIVDLMTTFINRQV